jgi:hypothetical protein
MLRKGPTGFRVYVRWLRGQVARTPRSTNPSLDDPESYYIDVKTGVIHTNVGDLANFLNEGISNSPLKNVKLSGDGDQLKLTGILHKVVPLPIEVISTIGVTRQRIQIHVTNKSDKDSLQEIVVRVQCDACQPLFQPKFLA